MKPVIGDVTTVTSTQTICLECGFAVGSYGMCSPPCVFNGEVRPKDKQCVVTYKVTSEVTTVL